MRSKPILFSLFFLIFHANLTARALQIPSGSNEKDYWSVIRTVSSYDSLKAKIIKAPTPMQALKDYQRALLFREQLQASDNHPAAFPTSAGIYPRSLAADSLSGFDQLLSLYRSLGDRHAEAGVLSSYGISKALKGDMDGAISFLKEAAQLNKQLNDLTSLVKNYFNLARVYRYSGNLQEAARYNESIMEIAALNGQGNNLGEAYMNLSSILTAQKRYKEAEALIMKKALPLYYYKLQNKIGAMKCYDQLAEIYALQKRYSEAKWFNIQSNMLARKINNPAGIINSLINLAHVKMSIGDNQLALRDLKEAEQLSVSIKYKSRLAEIKNGLSRVYTALGNKSAANSALSEFTVLKNALLSVIY